MMENIIENILLKSAFNAKEYLNHFANNYSPYKLSLLADGLFSLHKQDLIDFFYPELRYIRYNSEVYQSNINIFLTIGELIENCDKNHFSRQKSAAIIASARKDTIEILNNYKVSSEDGIFIFGGIFFLDSILSKVQEVLKFKQHFMLFHDFSLDLVEIKQEMDNSWHEVNAIDLNRINNFGRLFFSTKKIQTLNEKIHKCLSGKGYNKKFISVLCQNAEDEAEAKRIEYSRYECSEDVALLVGYFYFRHSILYGLEKRAAGIYRFLGSN